MQKSSLAPSACRLPHLLGSLGCLAFASGLPLAQSLPVLKSTFPASWDETWFSSPAVYDLDGDGASEIIVSRAGVLIVYDTAGTLVWRAAPGSPGTLDDVHGSSRQYVSPVVGDLDGAGPEGRTGKGEIAIAYGNQAAVYDAEGKLMPGWPQTFPGANSEVRSLAAADLDKDGKLELIAVKTGKGPAVMAWNLDGKAVPGWPRAGDCEECNEAGGFNQNVGAADLHGDGKPEVVATYDMAYIGVFHGDGKPKAAAEAYAVPWCSSVPMFHDAALSLQGHGEDGQDRDEFTNSPPVFADLDGDGKSEIILYSNREKAGDTTASFGNCLWALHGDMTRVKGFEKPLCSDAPIFTGHWNNIVETAPVPALGNLAGDVRPEIVVPSNDGTIRCFSPDGVQLWKYTYDVAGEPWIMASEAAIGDLNKDGKPEVVFTTYSVDHFVSHLTVLDAGGRMQRKVTLDKRGAMAAPTLADVDGDKRIDIVLNLKDVMGGGKGGVQIWTVESAGDAPPLWPTGRGSYLRTGQAPMAQGPVGLLRPARPSRKAFPRGALGHGPWVDALGIRAERGEGSPRLLLAPAPAPAAPAVP